MCVSIKKSYSASLWARKLCVQGAVCSLKDNKVFHLAGSIRILPSLCERWHRRTTNAPPARYDFLPAFFRSLLERDGHLGDAGGNKKKSECATLVWKSLFRKNVVVTKCGCLFISSYERTVETRFLLFTTNYLPSHQTFFFVLFPFWRWYARRKTSLMLCGKLYYDTLNKKQTAESGENSSVRNIMSKNNQRKAARSQSRPAWIIQTATANLPLYWIRYQTEPEGRIASALPRALHIQTLRYFREKEEIHRCDLIYPVFPSRVSKWNWL